MRKAVVWPFVVAPVYFYLLAYGVHNWLGLFAATFSSAGSACNALAVFSNGGRMPVKKPPHEPIRGCCHKYLTPDTRFPSLCDRFRVNGYTLSVGDFLLIVGQPLLICAVVFKALRYL
jgi:hypothetical protein